MKCERTAGGRVLSFEDQERALLVYSLEEIAEMYARRSLDLSDRGRSYWQGRLSRDPMTTRELGEANSDLQEAREELRVDRLAQVNKWLANDSPLRNQSKGAFMLDEEEVEEFLVIVNDRRLLLAMEKQLDRTHLDQDLLEVKQPELQQSLLEIHFLASVQYVILETL